MNIITTSIEGILIIEPHIFKDKRGYFMETYNQHRYKEFGIHTAFVQDNLSYSLKNTLRGLHYQIKHPQAKLIQVISGEVFDVAVDIRPDSPTLGKWIGIHLSNENGRQVFIPEGFAHGFCVLSEFALFYYKCSAFYSPDDEGGILWCDPDIGIKWPVEHPIISERDKRHHNLSKLTPEQLPSL